MCLVQVQRLWEAVSRPRDQARVVHESKALANTMRGTLPALSTARLASPGGVVLSTTAGRLGDALEHPIVGFGHGAAELCAQGRCGMSR